MTEPTPSSAGEIAAELLTHDWWTPAQLAAHQQERLGALVRHAVAESPYYRRVLGGAVPPDVRLTDLPTLSKTTLMAHFDEIVTDDRLRRGAASAHLESAEPGRLLAGHRVFATAGSSGEPGIFVYAEPEFRVWVASHLRMLATMGVAPGTRALSIGAPGPRHLSRQMFAEMPGAGASRPAGTPELYVTTPIPEMVAALNAYGPDAISTYASIAALLAAEQRAGRLRISPTMIATGAEVLTGDMRDAIHAAWSIEPHEAYLATEAPLLASTCPARVGMHLWEDLVLVEVVDAYDHPVPAGTPGHRLLLTNLVNHAQPLIRYELSDAVTLAPGPNPTSRPFRRLARVEGRTYETITLPTPDGGETPIHPAHLRAPFAAAPEVAQYQVTFTGEALTAQVVLRPYAGPEAIGPLRTGLRESLRRAGAVPPPITITPVQTIARDEGHAAKLPQIRVRPSA